MVVMAVAPMGLRSSVILMPMNMGMLRLKVAVMRLLAVASIGPRSPAIVMPVILGMLSVAVAVMRLLAACLRRRVMVVMAMPFVRRLGAVQ